MATYDSEELDSRHYLRNNSGNNNKDDDLTSIFIKSNVARTEPISTRACLLGLLLCTILAVPTATTATVTIGSTKATSLPWMSSAAAQQRRLRPVDGGPSTDNASKESARMKELLSVSSMGMEIPTNRQQFDYQSFETNSGSVSGDDIGPMTRSSGVCRFRETIPSSVMSCNTELQDSDNYYFPGKYACFTPDGYNPFKGYFSALVCGCDTPSFSPETCDECTILFIPSDESNPAVHCRWANVLPTSNRLAADCSGLLPGYLGFSQADCVGRDKDGNSFTASEVPNPASENPLVSSLTPDMFTFSSTPLSTSIEREGVTVPAGYYFGRSSNGVPYPETFMVTEVFCPQTEVLSDSCVAFISTRVVIGGGFLTEVCNAEILPATSDGKYPLSFDCSNVFQQGNCIAVDADGNCVAADAPKGTCTGTLEVSCSTLYGGTFSCPNPACFQSNSLCLDLVNECTQFDGCTSDLELGLISTCQDNTVSCGGTIEVDCGTFRTDTSCEAAIGCSWVEQRSETSLPTSAPTPQPTMVPTLSPTTSPPTPQPTVVPTLSPTLSPTDPPTLSPTTSPPTPQPTEAPTLSPTTLPPTPSPTNSPTLSPTTSPPTDPPTLSPTTSLPESTPTNPPTLSPTLAPSVELSNAPTIGPMATETAVPTITPSTLRGTQSPTIAPFPSVVPSLAPSEQPTDVQSSVPSQDSQSLSPTQQTASPPRSSPPASDETQELDNASMTAPNGDNSSASTGIWLTHVAWMAQSILIAIICWEL